ncbi:microfibril-associated glycoprotein 4-like [Ruditapes philippinarum]|uniref:microfibril-associated glycoprotein 4-like n=1 Tax=Ruditapes philippinarum TaxID=129788 RepID=UPI00295B68E9|nr:microfibril-associated glycoprotein 4-like [Ruditapes philippinarum]
MCKLLMITAILGYVAAKNESIIYLPLVKIQSDESSHFDKFSDTEEFIEKIFANILNRQRCTCYSNRTDVATKADLAELKRDMIADFSARFLDKSTGKSKPIDCGDIYNEGHKKTDIYTIYPSRNKKGVSVRCDMDTSGGGWTVIQRRVSKSDFYKTWAEYETGFGNLRDNFYLGNRFIHEITCQDKYQLRVDLTSFQGESAYAEYSHFSIGDSESSYQLHVDGYSGTAGDALKLQNGMKFSTKDRDNDQHGSNYKCAVVYHGAWWYKHCHHSNLNGLYGSSDYGKGTNWYQWKGHYTSMKTMEMKIRRKK